MMLKDLVLQNRSYRGFDESRKITMEELLDMIDHARLTPSSRNAQPLCYYAANETDEVAKIQAQTKWAGALPELNLPFEGTKPTAFIVVCINKTISDQIQAFQKDVGIAAQTILLRAAEMGLGGCMIGSFAAGKLSGELELPEDILPQLVIALGKPMETVKIVEVEEGDSVKYYRDEANVHYVPKRKLEDIVITKR